MDLIVLSDVNNWVPLFYRKTNGFTCIMLVNCHMLFKLTEKLPQVQGTFLLNDLKIPLW